MNKIFAVLFLLYPVVIFFAIKKFDVSTASLVVVLLLFCRLFIFRPKADHPFARALEIILWPVLIYNLVNLYFHNELALKVYPFLMSFSFFCLFAHSLFLGKPIIEKFARLYSPDLSPEKLKYITRLTLIWTGWLLVNSIFAFYTMLWTDFEIWVFYNNVVFYVVSGGIFAIDLIYRKFFLSYRNV